MELFEILKSDLRGRIGMLHTNHGSIDTPAFVPVVHPVKQIISPDKLKSMGFGMVITNAYITKKRYGNEAIKKGIHNIINFDGIVMTDSGGYQVLEYGDVEVTPPEMAAFERGILSDLAIPLDRPTGLGLGKKRASEFVRHTLRVSEQTLADSKDNGQIWLGPIQGSEYSDLVKRSTKKLVETGFGMLALGSPVEFMESYKYGLLSQMIISAKRHMPHHIPLHLFGAGHPLTVGFSVALGCDTFDSASYVLYAKNGRYITEDGTRHIRDIAVFPCSCNICTSHTPKEINEMDQTEKTRCIAMHNLYSIKNEVDSVKQAIFEGRLWEYIIKKARAHPKLFEIISIITGNDDFFAETTPRFKSKAIFLYDSIDQFRPEVLYYHSMAERFKTRKKKLIITRESSTRPAYLSGQYRHMKKMPKIKEFQVCQYSPHLGIIPLEISDVFPAAHHETADAGFDPRDFATFGKTCEKFFANNKFAEVHYDKDDKFLAYFMRKIPSGTKKIRYKNKKM